MLRLVPYIPSAVVALFNLGLQMSGYTNFTVAVCLWALCVVLVLLGAWHHGRAWHSARKAIGKMAFEPVHVIIVGVLIAAAGIGWQLYRGSVGASISIVTPTSQDTETHLRLQFGSGSTLPTATEMSNIWRWYALANIVSFYGTDGKQLKEEKTWTLFITLDKPVDVKQVIVEANRPLPRYEVKDRDPRSIIVAFMGDPSDILIEVRVLSTTAIVQPHLETVASPPLSAKPGVLPPDREFTNRTPRQLLALYEGRTPFQADKLMEPFKGLWIEAESKVLNVIPDGAGRSAVVLRDDNGTIECRFGPEWSNPVARLDIGDSLRVHGRISANQNGQQLYLSNCEIAPKKASKLDEFDTFIAAVNELLGRKVSSKAKWEDWQKDHDRWNADTLAFFENKVSAVAAYNFKQHPTIVVRPMSGAYNDEHNSLLNRLAERRDFLEFQKALETPRPHA